MTEKSWVHYLCFDAYFEDALMKMRASTGLGATYALFNALNEYFYEYGYMDEKGYQYHKVRYGQTLVDELEKKIEIEVQSAQLHTQQKELELKKARLRQKIDYSQLSLEDLQKQYNRYVKHPKGHAGKLQLLAFELKKRRNL